MELEGKFSRQSKGISTTHMNKFHKTHKKERDFNYWAMWACDSSKGSWSNPSLHTLRCWTRENHDVQEQTQWILLFIQNLVWLYKDVAVPDVSRDIGCSPEAVVRQSSGVRSFPEVNLAIENFPLF